MKQARNEQYQTESLHIHLSLELFTRNGESKFLEN
jgi:hypothetical protein